MIRPHIIVERAGPPTATRRQALLREGGDGLQPDDTADSCENTVQGAHMITDSMGACCIMSGGCCLSVCAWCLDIYVATCRLRVLEDAAGPRQARLLQRDGRESAAHQAVHVRPLRHERAALLRRLRALRLVLYAPAQRARSFLLDGCIAQAVTRLTTHCVAMLQTNTRREFLTHAEPAHPIYGDPSSLTVFQYCRARCRSSSASVQHQNSYRRCVIRSTSIAGDK